jgi:formate hydrogenlyase subunit 3/multisubunit Na+/H+ antiporter MnhD subunit
MWTSAKIGLLMVVVVAVGVVLIALISGALPGLGVLVLTLIAAAFSLVISLIWALATWAADQYVARARMPDR